MKMNIVKRISYFYNENIFLFYLELNKFYFYSKTSSRKLKHRFYFLYLVKPMDPRFMMCIAACHHMSKKYEDAAKWYEDYCAIFLGDPMAYYHLSDCYLHLNKVPEALKALQNTIDLAQDKPEYRLIVERANLMKQNYEKKTKAA